MNEKRGILDEEVEKIEVESLSKMENVIDLATAISGALQPEDGHIVQVLKIAMRK